ncbi:hypothetical protein HRI_004476500 [Hibiscus trionum]|uniref:Retrotransposon gag domain-containing protein n=1 Tax=Hibiscus trionum TaxID=183268 RepID=A0A9W7J4M9_HIBTR|nr:hypothetical protein HRI_004476500 [Hibiscus trionum]
MEATRGELLGEIKKLSAELSLYENVVLAGMMGKTIETKLRIGVPKPKEFKGARDAQEVDNSIWNLEYYFRLSGIDDEDTKVNTASIYLVDSTLLWWRHKCYQYKDETILIKTWKEFQFEFKEHFYPKNTKEEAQEKLHRLKHDDSIWEYVNKFTELRLQIHNMSEVDALFIFKIMLQLCENGVTSNGDPRSFQSIGRS